MSGSSSTDCRSEEGITVGLIDAIISVARIAAKRDLTPKVVRAALEDLREDGDLKQLLGKQSDGQ